MNEPLLIADWLEELARDGPAKDDITRDLTRQLAQQIRKLHTPSPA